MNGEKVKVGKIVAISISDRRGIPKRNVSEAVLIQDYGIEGDAHAGNWHRQVSLLALESVKKIWEAGVKVRPGGFAENITTEGFDLSILKVGDIVALGDCVLEITQLGKKCHAPCAIAKKAGFCVLPTEGVFARVVKGGRVKVGDRVYPPLPVYQAQSLNNSQPLEESLVGKF